MASCAAPLAKTCTRTASCAPHAVRRCETRYRTRDLVSQKISLQLFDLPFPGSPRSQRQVLLRRARPTATAVRFARADSARNRCVSAYFRFLSALCGSQKSYFSSKTHLDVRNTSDSVPKHLSCRYLEADWSSDVEGLVGPDTETKRKKTA